jgi:type IV fimbrial biogenesis protein FimT
MASIPSSPRRRAGFTLLELLTVMVVAGVLLAVAVPSMRKMVLAGRMRAASTDLISDLVLARSEALKRAAQVQVQPSTSGWSGGWTVQTASGAQQLAQRNQLGVAVTTAPDSITFDIDGRVVASAPVHIGLSDGTSQRCISLDPSGRPKSASVDCTP